MKTIPAFEHFERGLRDDHREQLRTEHTKLEGEAPPMPPPKCYSSGHGAPIKAPVGAFKKISADIPSADFLIIAERAKAKGWALSTYVKSLLHEHVKQEQPQAAAV